MRVKLALCVTRGVLKGARRATADTPLVRGTGSWSVAKAWRLHDDGRRIGHGPHDAVKLLLPRKPGAGATPAITSKVPTDVAPRAREGCVADVSISRNVRLCRAQPPSAHCADGTSRTTLPVCLLPHPGAHLQLLRPGSALLHAWLRGPGTQAVHAGGRQALSGQSPWAPCPCRASAPLPGAANESDASGFPTRTPCCFTATGDDSAGDPPPITAVAALRAVPFLPAQLRCVCTHWISALPPTPSRCVT